MQTTKYLNILLIWSLFFVTFIAVPTAFALQVEGLYQHRVLVTSDSDAERNRAFREALRAVIVKVAGEYRWLDHPDIEAALANPERYIESISYSTDSVNRSLLGQVNNELSRVETRYIEVSFANSLIDELLAESTIPVWGSNRPSILVWMVLQNSLGERTMLTPDINPEIIEYMQGFAEERGIPIIFPVFDFEDRKNLSEDEIWTLVEEEIIKASERYGADSILSGRLHYTAGGDLVGLWQFLFQDEVLIFDGFEDNLESYLYLPLDRVVSQLARYFGIVPDAGIEETVKLRIEGVSDLKTYSALINYISGLGLVRNVKNSFLDGERLEIELGLVGNSSQLFEIITLDRDLMPIGGGQVDDLGILHYRWTR